MKLHYSPASPYVRKVMACAIARGLDGRIEKVDTNPHVSPAGLLADNPLSKVPALVADDGTAIYDSPVICEYLDTIGDAPALFPPTGTPARLAAQIMHATADGIMDAAVARRMQMALPQDDGRKAFDARQKAAIDRALGVLEKNPPKALTHIGEIATACALGYLDFRFGQEPWREAHPALAAWFAEVSKAAPVAQTVPVG
ncbi:glutathione S-transferase N-terminal domain-containing protein [Neoroseomonas oryzicola]|uniref:Glutathione S-transferase n=1 Tax=Neoroseomonas oryzicola TaxID=535904 RepID=A0A9X9WDN6_9PROT|nr:glutathione S-transferase N-terminal domain-containing protein [Neoroseomonas oryzicola]MBR0658446.1 glutathione S-transferase [Neoroseomonas oryzicola]NKE17635.1 glutathione S-transferase [Neoroseomonas oryzicola]